MNENQAIKHAELVRQAMDPNTPKTEREHALVREIEMLREAIEGVPAIEHVAGSHIPGPWHVSKHRDGRVMLVYDAGGFEVARVCYPNRDANAALIAAAPELLSALRIVTGAYLDFLKETFIKNGSYKLHDRAWQAAQRAIQMATHTGTEISERHK